MENELEDKEINESEKEVKKGFYLAEVPSSFTNAVIYGDKVLDSQSLLVACANALEKNGLLKL